MAKVKTAKKLLWRAIREKCLDCMGGQYKEIELCSINDCSLFQYRLGKCEPISNDCDSKDETLTTVA